jgi:hypothetical protein
MKPNTNQQIHEELSYQPFAFIATAGLMQDLFVEQKSKSATSSLTKKQWKK